jgi:vacuolar-type H+-ATPase subunit I/STV1
MYQDIVHIIKEDKMKRIARNVFGSIFVVIGFLLSILGVMYKVKENNATILIVGIIMSILGILISAYKAKTKITIGISLAVVLGITIVTGLIIPTESERRENEIADAEKWKEQDNGVMAYVMVTQHIKEQLKSPSTAKFPNFTDKNVIVSKDDFVYTVSGFVDSQNGFGATVRTQYEVIIEQISKNDWQYKDIKIFE